MFPTIALALALTGHTPPTPLISEAELARFEQGYTLAVAQAGRAIASGMATRAKLMADIGARKPTPAEQRLLDSLTAGIAENQRSIAEYSRKIEQMRDLHAGKLPGVEAEKR